MLKFKQWISEIGIPYTMVGPDGPNCDPEGLSRAVPTVNPDEDPPTEKNRLNRPKLMKKKMRRK